MESKFDGGRFFFPDANEPTPETGAYQDQGAFATAMLQGTTPTLLFHGGEFAKDREVLIQQLCPVQFPFYIRGIRDRRKKKVSQMECLEYYMRLALPQMHRPIFVFLVCSMYQRLKSFSTAFVRCKSSFHGQTLAEHVSKLTVDDVELASKRLSVGLPNNGSAASRLLTAVSASCKPIGHSNEAAADARKKYFALRDYFGPQAVFFTFSPCDECSFRIRLYATSGKVRH